MPPPGKKKARRITPPVLTARLSGEHITLQAQADRTVAANFHGYSVGLGQFSPAVLSRLQELRTGVPIASLASNRPADKEMDLLVRRLARSGLIEYRFGRPRADRDLVVIEPQTPDYWPRTPKLGNRETIALSRFAYMRRRRNEMVLESPRAGALFRIRDPNIVTHLATLSSPQKISKCRTTPGFPGVELLALLLDCHILFKVESALGDDLRSLEGNDDLVVWDFHDLLFHARSTEGRHANPLGGLYPYADLMPPPPAVRSPWPGAKIDLQTAASPDGSSYSENSTHFVALLSERHSTRDFDDQHPITLAELGRLLQDAARVRAKWTSSVDMDEGGPEVSYAARPYPSGGAAYELELYLSVANCDGLARGFYHYDADLHALSPIAVKPQDFEAQLMAAKFAMGASAVPQILITIAARFSRVSWKYSSVAYSLILKNVGVLFQTLYLILTDMGLGGCAIGTNNIDLFSKMTGLEFHVEGPVGQFAVGRCRKNDADEAHA